MAETQNKKKYKKGLNFLNRIYSNQKYLAKAKKIQLKFKLDKRKYNQMDHNLSA